MQGFVYVILATMLTLGSGCNREVSPASDKKTDSGKNEKAEGAADNKPVPEDVTLVDDGQTSLHLGDNQSAIEKFNKAIEANPKNADAYYWRAVAKCYLNDNAGCCQDYAEAAKIGHLSAKEMLEKYCGK